MTDDAVVRYVRDLLARPGPVVIDAERLAGLVTADPAAATRVLDEFVARGDLRVETRYACPCCHESLEAADAALDACPLCAGTYTDCGTVATTIYVRDAPPTRSLSWVVVLHGMNTRGKWQEDLKFLVDSTAGHAVPFDVDKYGKVRPGALSRWRLRRLTDRVAKRLRSRATTNDPRLGPRPDVIAHSLGTLLIGHALVRHPDIAVGRVVLTGCILRPDFDWTALVAQGRVEAVLNHRGGRDRWVLCAPYVIPDAGPAGRCGFLTGTVERETPDVAHSDLFGDRMRETYDTIWRPFLTWPADDLAALGDAGRPSRWRPRPLPLRAPVLPLLAVALVAALIVRCYPT